MSVLNPRDSFAYNAPTFEPIEQNPAKKKTLQGPKIEYVGELADLFNEVPAKDMDKKTESLLKKQLNFSKVNLNNMLTQICLIAILSSAQSRNISREHLQKSLERMSEEVTIKASLYNNRIIWTLTVVGGAASVIAGAYGSFAMTNAINANGLARATNFISQIQTETGVWQSGGQLLEKIGSFMGSHDRSKQELSEHIIQKLSMFKDISLQNSQTASAKEDEFIRILQQLNSMDHSAKTQVLGQNG
jgi:hypothetical protein